MSRTLTDDLRLLVRDSSVLWSLEGVMLIVQVGISWAKCTDMFRLLSTISRLGSKLVFVALDDALSWLMFSPGLPFSEPLELWILSEIIAR